MSPIERVANLIGAVGTMLGICFQNLCMTIGFGLILVAANIRDWDKY